MTGEVQPSLADSMIADTTLLSTPMTRTCPTGSNLRARAARDCGTNSAVHTIAAATIGTLTQKMARQPTPPTKAPPRIGPSASARPDTEPNTPMALARSARPGNVVATIDIATGLSIVPPAPCSTRAAISQPMPGASPHSSEPRPKAARPAWKTRRRPNRSAADPASTRKLASTRV
jgi:hypothetical protein